MDSIDNIARKLQADLVAMLDVYAREAVERGCGLIVVQLPIEVSDDLTTVTAHTSVMVSPAVPAGRRLDFPSMEAYEAWRERQP